MRVGWTCAVAYCGKLHHMRLVKRKNLHWRDYLPYARAVAALRPGSHVDFPEIPNSAADVLKFSCGLRTRKELLSLKVSIHRLAAGGVRVVRQSVARERITR